MLLLLLIALASGLFLLNFLRSYYYWDKRGVPNVKGWPIVGKQLDIILGRLSPIEWIKTSYYEFPHNRYSGSTQFNRPVLIIRDPEIIKQITVRYFDHFVNRFDLITADMDSLMGKSLLFLRDHEWRTMRCTLSPAFTSSKIKSMFHLMAECIDDLNRYFLLKGSNTIAIDMKDVVTRLSNDVIATCAFGVKCNSLKDKKNEFYTMGKEIINFGGVRIIKVFIYSTCRFLFKFIELPIFPRKVNLFFRNVVKKTIAHREKNSIVRPDLIHLLMEARRGKLKFEGNESAGFASVDEHTDIGKDVKTNISDDDMTAQSLLFFFAGLEPVSTTICFMAHELAMNPRIQERLSDEIDQAYQQCSGKFTYEAILKMKYMDMVVSETLRKWPPVPVLNRMCTKETTIHATREGEDDLIIEKGMVMITPIVGIHSDEKYYADPEHFDPERFNEENRANIKQYTYLPFGIGPRNCIGSRFALLEIKMFFATLLTNFEICAIEKTPSPIKLKKRNITLAPEGGFWVGFKPRVRNVTPYY